MRGTRRSMPVFDDRHSRITPAHAGNTKLNVADGTAAGSPPRMRGTHPGDASICIEDHPRACGEHTKKIP